MQQPLLEGQTPPRPDSGAERQTEEAQVRDYVSELAKLRPERAYRLMRGGEPDPVAVDAVLKGFRQEARERGVTLKAHVDEGRAEIAWKMAKKADPDWFKVHVGYRLHTNFGLITRQSYEGAHVVVQGDPQDDSFEMIVKVALPHKVRWTDNLTIYTVSGPYATKGAAANA